MTQNKLARKTGFDYICIIILAILAFCTLYPFWNVLMISLNDPQDTLNNGISIIFRKFTLQNYKYFISKETTVRALWISIARTVVGASTSVLFTAAFSYGVSKSYLLGGKLFKVMMLIPMYISGGLIPTFLLIKSIGLYQNFLVYIIPCLFSSYNAIIMITSFKALPGELEESVRIDGGNDLVIFFRIVFPVSMPMIATIILFNAVGQWNSWYDCMLYGGRDLMTLQMQLVELTQKADQTLKQINSGRTSAKILMQENYNPNIESVKATSMAITALPIIMIYPFLQKYFVKGVMVGSLKG